MTTLLPTIDFDPARTVSLVCGPEIMMRFTVRGLVDLGVPMGAIRVSLERNMQCGIGWCGHCQLGPLLICRDGPVFDYSQALEKLISSANDEHVHSCHPAHDRRLQVFFV